MLADPISTTAPEFLAALRDAVAEGRELLVLCRRANRGGADWDWWLIHTEDEIQAILTNAPFLTAISVFLEPELTLRGIANPLLLERAQHLLKVEGEILAACLPEDGTLLEITLGTDEAVDLVEWFHDHEGAAVAIGRFPDFGLPNGSGVVVTGYVPDANGIIRRASY